MIHTNDFEGFVNYARTNLTDAESIVELAHRWEQQREYDEAVAAAQRGIDDVEAGRVTPADEVFAEIRRKLKSDR